MNKQCTQWIIVACLVIGLTPVVAIPVFDLRKTTVRELSAALDAGELTSEALVNAYTARIEAYNIAGPALRAVIAVAPNALEVARALDAERARSGPRSPLHGIPIIIKDTVDTIDAPTSGGAIAYANTYPRLDATIITKLKDAGAIIFAKGNLDEFNRGSMGLSSLGGQTINPYDLTRNPGGSSSGPGVGVTVGFAAIGIGTETGASIRSPASNSSLVGLAPSQGLFSRAGILPISYTQDRAGPMARSVWDAALLSTHMRGLDAADLFTHGAIGKLPGVCYTTFLDDDGLRGARIGVLRDMFRKGDEYAEINSLIEAEIGVMQAKGAVIIDGLSTGMDIVKFIPMARTNAYEFYEAFRVYAERRGDTLPFQTLEDLYENGEILARMRPGILNSIEMANTEYHPEYLARLHNRDTIRSIIIELMDRYHLDVIVYPFKGVTAPPIGTGDRGIRDNPVSAVTGLPALVVPAGVNSEGLPISVEFLGRLYSEPMLFRLGHAYEQATQHRILPTTTPPLVSERSDF